MDQHLALLADARDADPDKALHATFGAQICLDVAADAPASCWHYGAVLAGGVGVTAAAVVLSLDPDAEVGAGIASCGEN
jgi:hypothetical protein